MLIRVQNNNTKGSQKPLKILEKINFMVLYIPIVLENRNKAEIPPFPSRKLSEGGMRGGE